MCLWKLDHPRAQCIQFMLDLYVYSAAELSNECVGLIQTQLTLKVLGLLGECPGKCAYPVPSLCGETLMWCCLQSILSKQCSADWIWGRKHLWCPKADEVLFPEPGKQIKKLMLCLRETLVLEAVLEIWLLHFFIFFPPGLHVTLLFLIKFETGALLIFLARLSL